jgi:hypothetical protein
MVNRLGPGHQTQGAEVIVRAVGALALAALAVIHVVDLPATLGPTPLVGAGYFAIIAAAVVTGGVMITRSHWLTWAATVGVAVMAMGGYVLTRAIPGGFLGDHTDVGNWDCPLGISALSVETLIILLAAGWGAWQAWTRGAHRPRRSSVLSVLPGSPASAADHDRPLRPVQ